MGLLYSREFYGIVLWNKFCKVRENMEVIFMWSKYDSCIVFWEYIMINYLCDILYLIFNNNVKFCFIEFYINFVLV